MLRARFYLRCLWRFYFARTQAVVHRVRRIG